MQVYRSSGEARCCGNIFIPPFRSGPNFGLIFLLVLACFALTLERITVKVMVPERGSKI